MNAACPWVTFEVAVSVARVSVALAAARAAAAASLLVDDSGRLWDQGSSLHLWVHGDAGGAMRPKLYGWAKAKMVKGRPPPLPKRCASDTKRAQRYLCGSRRVDQGANA